MTYPLVTQPRSRSRSVVATVAAVGLFAGTSGDTRAQTGTPHEPTALTRFHLRSSTQRVASLPALNVAPRARDTLLVSPSGRRIAYVATNGVSEFVVVGHNRGKHYTAVSSLRFSPNSHRLAYIAKDGTKEFVVVDGEEEAPYDAIASPPVFSPDSRRLAYFATKAGRSFLVVDTREGPWVDRVPFGDHGLTFSPDSQRTAAAASRDGQAFVLLNNVPQRAFRAVKSSSIAFSHHSLGYVASDGINEFVVVDEQTGPQYGGITRGPVFAPTGGRVAYVAYEHTRRLMQQVVVGTDRGQLYDEIVDGPVFNSDGTCLAYVARDGREQFVVVNGVERKRYRKVFDLVFSRQGERLAWTAETNAGEIVVVDGVESAAYDEVGRPTFSPDGRRVAHPARIGGGQAARWLMVVDTRPGKGYPGIEGRRFTNPLSDPFFSPDSQTLAYAVVVGRTFTDSALVVINGHEGEVYDAVFAYRSVGQGELVFSSSDTIHYLAHRRGDVEFIAEGWR